MNLIVTLDDEGGMMFNHRRQSRDRVLCARLLALVGSSRLFMNRYTAGLFTGGRSCVEVASGESPGATLPAGVMVADDFLSLAGKGDFCFVEDAPLNGIDDRVETVYIFRWNRVYPSDQRLPFDLSSWRMTVVDEFSGSSHEKITLERYDR